MKPACVPFVRNRDVWSANGSSEGTLGPPPNSVSEDGACSCDRKLAGAIERGRVDSQRVRFADEVSQDTYTDVRGRLRQTTEELRTLKLQTAIPRFGSPANFGRMIEELVTLAGDAP